MGVPCAVSTPGSQRPSGSRPHVVSTTPVTVTCRTVYRGAWRGAQAYPAGTGPNDTAQERTDTLRFTLSAVARHGVALGR